MPDIVESAIVRLVREQPFYGSLLLNLQRLSGARAAARTQTACVFAKPDGTLGMAVNEDFFETLSLEEQEAVLTHECLHLVHMHLHRGVDDFDDDFLANVAMDLVINQYIDGLPDGALRLDSFGDLELLPEQTADWYYAKLKTEVDRIRKDIDEGRIKIVDDHEWGDPAKVPRVLVEAAVRNAIGDARERAKQAGAWGSVPNGVQRTVDKALTPQVDWKTALRRFAGERIRVDTTTTRKRRHRRYGWDFPGRKPVRGARLLVAVDTSGSVDDKQLAQFLAEIDVIGGRSEVLLAEVDSVVQQVYTYNPRRTEVSFKGGGGTSFQVLWDAIHDKAFPELRHPVDGIIYFTDGWATWPDSDGGIPTLWVVTDRSRVPTFGKTVYIDP